MESKITIFESEIVDGIMSRNKKFYKDETSEEEINKIFLDVRMKLGKKYGFNGKKIFQALQKTEKNKVVYPDGQYHVIDYEDIQNDDLWYVEIPADILIISSQYKNIVVGNQMADCPILIIEDRRLGVTALSHCGARYINRYLPYHTAESLIKEFNSNPDDLYAYIGSNAKKESYTYDKYPLWATNTEVWKKNIIKNQEQYYIDMEGAIIRQLYNLNIQNIEISPYNTVTDERYYSHSAFTKGKTYKKGQNFVGFFYK